MYWYENNGAQNTPVSEVPQFQGIVYTWNALHVCYKVKVYMICGLYQSTVQKYKASEDARPRQRPNQREWKYREGHQRG